MKNDIVLSAKGQVTLPKEMREILSIGTGDVITCKIVNGNLVLTPKSTSFLDVAGMLGEPPNGPASIDEINETVRRAGGANSAQKSAKSKVDAV